MEVVTMSEVEIFVASLDVVSQNLVLRSIDRLKEEGFQLSMPVAKPIGDKMWELRIGLHPRIRILYGFYKGVAILLVGYVKKESAIPRAILERAKRNLRAICN